ncbi:MAG: serine hydrolase [Cyclobacteriaceae bacterium]
MICDCRWATKHFYPLFFAFLSLLICGGDAFSQSDKKFFHANGERVKTDEFKEEINQMIFNMGVPGLSLAVIDDNKVSYYNAFGVKSLGGEPLDKNTIFDGCSLSKTLLVLVAHQLVDEGTLDLDKPLYSYLRNDKLDYDKRYKKITARMVLSHSSGMENWMHYNNQQKLDIIADPGTKYTYSGEGYHYLADVISSLLDKPYYEYVHDRVINRLGLTRTFLRYEKQSGDNNFVPANFAIGHQISGRQKAWNNTECVPAGGNHFTAYDYARLIISTFDGSVLSDEEISEVVTPSIQIHESEVSYGPGFEILRTENDLIIAHGGDKDGYKNQMFYSVKNKAGFVILSNSDWGKGMAQKINDLTVRLEIEPFLNADYFLSHQYPFEGFSLVKLTNEKGYDSLYSVVNKRLRSEVANVRNLNFLAYVMRWYGDFDQSKDLLDASIVQFPSESFAYVLRGEYYTQKRKYDKALADFIRAEELQFDHWSIEQDIASSREEIMKAEFRRRKLFSISLSSVIQAEDYNQMEGDIREVKGSDDSTYVMGYFSKGDWMDYKLDVKQEGEYNITLRVASPFENNKAGIYLDSELLCSLSLESTSGWKDYQSFTTVIRLNEGIHMLRLLSNSGDYTVNWIQLDYQPDTSVVK